jgi:hypothetical protein
VVVFLDFSKSEHIELYSLLSRFVQQKIPMRFGFVTLVHPKEAESSTTVASRIINNLLKRSKRNLLDKFIYLLGNGDVSSTNLKIFYESVSGSTYESIEINEERDNYRYHFASKLGSEDGGMFANGKYFEIEKVAF